MIVCLQVMEGVLRPKLLLLLLLYRFGESLETSEQEWLVWEINQKIAELKGLAPTLSDMGPEDAPDVSTADSSVFQHLTIFQELLTT